ncbi:hypothetical protein ACWCP6_26930 [Streptomyces sp. NPDC002004]
MTAHSGGALDPQIGVEAIHYAYRQPQNVNLREIVLAATGREATAVAQP